MSKRGWGTIYVNNKYYRYLPMIFTNGEWQQSQAHLLINSKWEKAGLTRFILVPFLDSNENILETSKQEWFMVPDTES